MSSANSILTRLAEVEAEKHLFQSQLSSVRKNRSPERPKRQTVFLQSSNNVKSPASTLDKVTGWLNNDKPAQRSLHSPLLDFFTQHERYHVVFDNIYQRLEIKDIVALYWLDSGLDIYVRQGAKADTLIRYIGEDKSYEFDHSYGWSDNDQHRTLTKVLIFRRTVPPGSPQIRFHLTRTLPLHSILTDCAFSTAHVNIITWNKAYCMFPNVTFIDRRMYFLHNPDEALGQILSKYSAHGWRTSEWVDYDQTKGCNKPGIRENFRRVGDSSSWVIPLNLHKIRTPESSDSILESCTFQIFPDSGPQKSRHAVTGLKTFSIGAQIFSCCMLKHNYTFHTPDASWSRFLRENLSRMIMLEILKTGDADLIARTRQPDFMLGDHKCCPLLRTRPRFQRPEGWEYVDHMIPSWLEEWKSARRNRTGSIDLTPHPLTVIRSKKQPCNVPQTSDLSSPPPLLPPRARSMTTSRLPSKTVPPLSSRSDHFPLSLRTTQQPPPRLPRSSSISHMNMPQTVTTKLPALKPSPRRVVSAQIQSSKSESMLSHKKSASTLSFNTRPSHIPAPGNVRPTLHPLYRTATSPQNTKSSRSSQTTTPATSPQKQKGDYFSLIHRRPKAPMPPPLNLSPTKLGPLMPDLLTPPPDMPLPDVPSERQPKRSPLHFPSHLPWSPFEKKSRGLPSKSGWISAASLSSSSTGPEKMIPGEMNWI
ncbi:hypothetical protein D6C78_02713 [Aureobasidium pullulans]|uniref:Uncharacterized protein n=1 Tax=Aureobasidium pullulans TaxID=5580 RepID=A0A4T0C3N3_AURPU|nr:hypothetical protein D6C78_02713 [Aureobasidium pullulans]